MRAKSFVQYVCLLAALLGLLLWRIAPPAADWSASTLAVVALLALTAELMGFLLPRGASGSISFIPYMTAVLLVPNFSALVAIIAARGIAEIAKKRDLLKIVFNTAQLAVSYALAIVVFVELGGRSLLTLRVLTVAQVTAEIGIAMALAYVLTFAVNTILVSRVIALASGGRTLQVWRENNAATVGLDVLALPLVFAFAWVYAVWGPMIASLLWLPILGLRQMNTTNLELAQTNKELLELMVKSIEARDPYTSGHSRRVKEYAIHIARMIGLGEKEVEKVGTAALLHDVGKIFDKYAPILAKEDRLTPEEWAVIKEHPGDGANLIATMTRLRELVPAVRHHHENWDGSGYPDGLHGEAIPLASRIIMFADTFDAMTTKRPYRGPLGEDAVRSELQSLKGRQFDPDIADKLLASDFWRTMLPPSDRMHSRPRLLQVIGSRRMS
jgi:putative nucleotidyltransferase with HDIG domain